MRTYYFDVETHALHRDTVGTTLPDEGAARLEACRRIADRAGDPAFLATLGACVVTVRDITGSVVLTARFACQIDPDDGSGRP